GADQLSRQFGHGGVVRGVQAGPQAGVGPGGPAVPAAAPEAIGVEGLGGVGEDKTAVVVQERLSAAAGRRALRVGREGADGTGVATPSRSSQSDAVSMPPVGLVVYESVRYSRSPTCSGVSGA